MCGDDTTDLNFVACGSAPVTAAPGTYQVTVTVRDALGRSSSVTVPFVVQAGPDADSDGLPDIWEARFFDDATSGNPGDDPDFDGRTNLQEFQAGTHPRGLFVQYFAEGADSDFFRTTLALFNLGSTVVRGQARMQASDGAEASVYLGADSLRSSLFDLTGHTPGNDFSLVIETDALLVVERTMVWGREAASSYPTWVDLGYGSHTEGATGAPSTTWYLAEGATAGAFDLFYLLQNPSDQPATATVRYLRPAPDSPIVRTYPLLPKSRRTIWVDAEDAALAATDMSASITADRPILVERSMYYSTPDQPFAAGHNRHGVRTPSTTWYLTEGATGFFNAYLLLANPQSAPATVTVTFLRDGGGAPIVKTYAVDPESRRTIDIAAEDPALVTASMGIGLTSTQPIGVERAMCRLTISAIDFIRSSLPQLQNLASTNFSVVIESGGAGIVAERAMCGDYRGVIWASGTAALGLPIP